MNGIINWIKSINKQKVNTAMFDTYYKSKIIRCADIINEIVLSTIPFSVTKDNDLYELDELYAQLLRNLPNSIKPIDEWDLSVYNTLYMATCNGCRYTHDDSYIEFLPLVGESVSLVQNDLIYEDTDYIIFNNKDGYEEMMKIRGYIDKVIIKEEIIRFEKDSCKFLQETMVEMISTIDMVAQQLNIHINGRDLIQLIRNDLMKGEFK